MRKTNEKHKNESNNTGITLIALVITIIVLLILAGVSIAMLTGDNGILSQAQKADVETRGAAVEEAKDLWKSNKTLDKATGVSTSQKLDDLLEDLKNQGLLTPEEVETIKETGIVTIGSRTIEFGSDALTLVEMFENAEKCNKNDGTCTDETHLHIGDYVNYNPGTGTYTSSGDNTGMNYYPGNATDEMKNQVFNVDTSTTWRILGVEGSGSNKHILLVSGNPIKKETNSNDPYFYLYGSYGYINAETELNNICAIYGNGEGADGARSIKIEDINTLCGVTVNDETKTIKPDGVNEDEHYGETRSYSGFDISSGNSGGTTGFTKTLDSYYYNGNNSLLKTANNTNLYNMIFYPSEEQEYKEYWLASSSVSFFDAKACAFVIGSVRNGIAGNCGVYLMSSDSNIVTSSNKAVRPVVSLKPDVTTKTIQKISQQTE